LLCDPDNGLPRTMSSRMSVVDITADDDFTSSFGLGKVLAALRGPGDVFLFITMHRRIDLATGQPCTWFGTGKG